VERARLSKRISGIEADAARVEAKLANDAFIRKAPVDIVEKERARLSALKEEATALYAQLEELG
jgi:valyl-tRNA synthetase